MSARGLDRRLLVPRPARLGARLALGVALPLVVTVVATVRSGSLALAWFGALFVVAEAALALALTHKEIIAASPSFFQPGLRRRLAAAQVTWGLGLAVIAAAVVGFLVPGGGGARAASLLGAAAAVFALLALLAFHVHWSFQLPFWIFYAWPLVRMLDRRTRAGELDGVYEAAWAWLPAGALLLAGLALALAAPALHRRLHGTVVLGAEDMFRPGRVSAYRQSRSSHQHAGGGPAWRARLVATQLRRAGRAGAQGAPAVMQRRRLQALCLASGVSPRPWVAPLVVALSLAAMVFFGYYDGTPRGGGLDHWFGGLLYQGATWPFFGLAAFMFAAPADLSRRSALRAECALLARLTVVAAASAVAVWLAFAALAAVLPPVVRDGAVVEFTTARPHGLWLVPLLAPFAWLGLALRPRPGSQWPTLAVGPLFILGHALLTYVPYGLATPLLAAASLAALAGAYALRRRWWERADIGH